MKIDEKRLRELERAEKKLNALESGGVENWEWYGASLADYCKEEDVNEAVDEAVAELFSIIGNHSYEPSETGAGFAVDESANPEIVLLFKELIAKCREIEKEANDAKGEN